jgi:hypothetical protein
VIRSWLGEVRCSFSLVVAVALIALAVPTTALAAQSWYSPTNVNGTNAFGPDIAVDDAGKAYAVFVDDGSFDLIKVVTRPAGSLSYGSTQTLSALNKNGFEPRIASAGNGAAVVAWTNTTDTTIQAAFKAAASSTFGAAVTISSAGAFKPDVAIDPQGNAQVIWARQTGATTIIEATTRSVSGGTFTAPEQLSQSAFVSDNPQLAAEPNGDASAVWAKFTGSGSIVEASARREFNYPRPNSATPFRVPLVTAFKQCTSPNSTHVTPLNLPSCTGPTLESSLLTMGTIGQGSGFLRYRALPGDGVVPPDDADINITVSITDVRCAVSAVTGCVLVGDDYTGQVVAGSTIRITDLAHGVFGDDPGTVDAQLTFPASCVATGGTAGSTCSASTSADTLVPGIAQERKRSIIRLGTVEIKDLGADGTMTPGGGATCPPTCGSGDEKVYMREGVVAP